MPSKYDAAADELFGGQESQLNASLLAAKNTNPDEFAKSVQLSRETGVPSNVVQLNQRAFEDQASLARTQKAISYDSVAAQWLADPNNAKLAHDDVENLSAMDSAVKGLSMAGRYIGGAGRAVASGIPAASAGLWGAIAAPFDLVGADSVGGWLRGMQRETQATADRVAGFDPDAGSIERGLMSGFQSAGQSLSTLPLGFAAQGERLMLGAMGAMTGGQSYGKGIEAGLTPAQAAAYGIEDATAEIITEKFMGAAGLLRNIKAGSSAAKLFAYEVAKEVPGEVGATLWQNFNEWMNVNPDKSVAQFIDEQPAEVGQTILATLVGGGTQIGVVKAVEKIIGTGEQATAHADQQSKLIEQINQLSQASKVAQRDVDTFENFLQKATEDGPVPDLYIDAQTLHQSGIADQVIEASPSVREQYQTALATGGSIRIPVSEYGARIATLPELSGPLLAHLKTDPMGFSADEAKTYQKEQGPALEAEIGRALEQAQGDDAFNASRDAVKQSVLDQLNAVGRNTPDVNEAYASLIAARTAVRAGQLGITPEAMMQKQLLGIQAEGMGADALNQSGSLAEVQKQWADAGINGAISENKDLITLSKIIVQKSERGSGKGTAAMQALVDYADASGKRIALSPSADFGGNKKRLTEFYKRFGFKLNKGVKRDLSVSESMIREPNILNQSAYHGSPHRFDRFDLSKIGTGEGAQAYGWGQYFADSKDVAEEYRAQTSKDAFRVADGALFNESRDLENPNVKVWLRKNAGDVDKTIVQVKDRLKSMVGIGKEATERDLAKLEDVKARGGLTENTGQLYTIDIPDEAVAKMLDWDRPLSEQPEIAGKILSDPRASRLINSAWGEFSQGEGTDAEMLETFTGEDVYRALSGHDASNALSLIGKSGSKDVSMLLGSLGIPGLRYLDQGSRTTGKGTRNTVIWDQQLLDQISENLQTLYQLGPAWKRDKKITRESILSANAYGLREFNAGNITHASWYSPQHASAYRYGTEGVDLSSLPTVSGWRRGKANFGAISKNHREGTSERGLSMMSVSGSKPGFSEMFMSDRDAHEYEGILLPDKGSDGEPLILAYGDQNIDAVDYGTLDQQNRGGFSPSKNIITLLKNADLSSFLHEGAHYFFENDIALAKELIAKSEHTAGEQQIMDDVHALLKWHGLEGDLNEQLDQWNQLDFEQKRVHHERTAESWEAYLFSGKAPSIELATYFQKFRQFMLNVYKSLKSFLANHPEAGKLNDEVRGVFDRMLATDEQIALAEQARSMLPLFKTAEEASQFGVDFDTYQALAKDSTQAAIETLQAQGMKDMQWLHNAHGREVTKLKKQSDALRREIRMEVRAEVLSRPIYQAWTFLTNKQTAEDKLPKATKPDTGIAEADRIEQENYRAGQGLNLQALGAGRLDAADINAMNLPPEIVKRLEDFKMTRKSGGLHPDLVADMFGLSSGDDLARALYDVDPPQAAIEKATDARMLAEHGELATPEAIEKAADRALYNAARGKMLVADANALASANNIKQDAGVDKKGRKRTVNILPKAAKEAAAALIARVKIRNLRPAQYEAAEMKAGKATEKAKNAGKLEEAAGQARTRLFNHYAAMAAHQAVDEVTDGVAYLKKVQTPGKLPADHFEQIQSILAKFDLRQATNKELDNTAMFQTWARAQLDAGNIPPNVELLLTKAQRAQYARELASVSPDGQMVYADAEKQIELLSAMLDQTPVRNYKELTIEEFRGLVESVKQIEHMGRRTKRVLTDRKKREFSAVVDTIKANIIAVATAKGRKSTDVRTPTDSKLLKLLSWRGFWGSHVKTAAQVQIMDGKDFGPLWEHLVQTANEAGNGEVLDGADAYKAVDDLLKTIKAEGPITGKAKFFPTIGESLNRQERLVMALNLGNASNEQRLLGGKSWTRDQIQPVLDTLSAADWKFVQGMWDLFESYRPRVAAMEREINGVEPEWIEAKPLQVNTADGQVLNLRGGYAPVIFDPRSSGKAASFAAEKDAKAMMQAARVSSTVNKSFTKARVTEVKGRPLLLSLDAMIGGIQDTIHYLHWQPWIIDANRLVKALDEPIREHYGAETVSQLRNWVGDNAAGTRAARDGAERAITNMARNVSFAGLAFNVFSAAQQITGYSQSIATVGAKWMGKGVAKTLASPRQAFTEAAEKSSFMRKRASTRMRDLAETHTVVRDQGKLRTALDETGYSLILAMQAAVDVPTWWAGYEKALDAGVDEAEAIQRADQGVIDSQGSGMAKDLASIERATGAIRLMTGFMSFMNTTLNINYRIAKSDQSVGKKAVDMVLVNAIPVILSMLIKSALTPGGDDDKDANQIAKEYAAEQFSFMMGQMVGFREIGQAGAGILGLPTFGYQGSTGTRIYADTITLAKQLGQGEFDDAMRKAVVNTAADFFRLPSAQINRTLTGTEALLSDETDNPAAIVFGYRK